MIVIKTEIPDVLIFEPKVFGDERGFFFESFNQKAFEEVVGRSVNFVQDNHSLSSKGVLRGLHYQLAPFAQTKLVRCLSGTIFDVAVDIRKGSATFGKWVGVELSASNKKQIWIPEGFAHGFIALEDATEIHYKTNNFYSKETERSILWNDAQLNIEWPIQPDIISDKDMQALTFESADMFSE
ncbi:dTDP-4-dehydrorhamnose 3,5-epimerase [Dryocola sp. LX212]